jgi:hypothetical protein
VVWRYANQKEKEKNGRVLHSIPTWLFVMIPQHDDIYL